MANAAQKRNARSPEASPRRDRLHLRLAEADRALIDRAASHAHLSVTEFVLSSALVRAEETIAAHERIGLTSDDFAAFLAALDQPREPAPALATALHRHRAWQGAMRPR